MSGERKEGVKNQTTIGDNPTIISCNMSLHMEKDMVAHLGRRSKAKLGQYVASHVSLE
jgi:hypothetical protein